MKGEPGVCFDDTYGVRIGKTTYPRLHLEVNSEALLWGFTLPT